MPAQPESYAIASGETLSAGRFRLPAWLPSVGEIVNVGLNTVYDVRGAETNTAALFNAWCTAAYAPDWGKYGSFVYHGGGHGDRAENSHYRYDIETRLTTKERQSCAIYQHSDSYVADTVTGWMWAATTGTEVQVGEPFVHHTYSNLIVVPESAIDGTAPNGWLFTLGRGSMPMPGQIGTNQTHKFALGVDAKWSFGGSPVVARGAHAFTIYDSLRNRLINPNGDNTYATSLYTYDLTTGSPGTMSFSGPTQNAYYHVGHYSESWDLYISSRWASSAIGLSVIDPVTQTHYKPTVVGTPPASTYEGAWAWDDVHHRLVLFQSISNIVYTLTPTGNPRTSNWEWSSYTLTGAVNPCVTSAPAFGRVRHVPKLDAYFWTATHNTPVQAFRIPS